MPNDPNAPIDISSENIHSPTNKNNIHRNEIKEPTSISDFLFSSESDKTPNPTTITLPAPTTPNNNPPPPNSNITSHIQQTHSTYNTSIADPTLRGKKIAPDKEPESGIETDIDEDDFNCLREQLISFSNPNTILDHLIDEHKKDQTPDSELLKSITKDEAKKDSSKAYKDTSYKARRHLSQYIEVPSDIKDSQHSKDTGSSSNVIQLKVKMNILPVSSNTRRCLYIKGECIKTRRIYVLGLLDKWAETPIKRDDRINILFDTRIQYNHTMSDKAEDVCADRGISSQASKTIKGTTSKTTSRTANHEDLSYNNAIEFSEEIPTYLRPLPALLKDVRKIILFKKNNNRLVILYPEIQIPCKKLSMGIGCLRKTYLEYMHLDTNFGKGNMNMTVGSIVHDIFNKCLNIGIFEENLIEQLIDHYVIKHKMSFLSFYEISEVKAAVIELKMCLINFNDYMDGEHNNGACINSKKRIGKNIKYQEINNTNDLYNKSSYNIKENKSSLNGLKILKTIGTEICIGSADMGFTGIIDSVLDIDIDDNDKIFKQYQNKSINNKIYKNIPLELKSGKGIKCSDKVQLFMYILIKKFTVDILINWAIDISINKVKVHDRKTDTRISGDGDKTDNRLSSDGDKTDARLSGRDGNTNTNPDKTNKTNDDGIFGLLYYLKSGKLIPIEYDPILAAENIILRNKLAWYIKKETIPPIPEDPDCSNCQNGSNCEIYKSNIESMDIEDLDGNNIYSQTTQIEYKRLFKNTYEIIREESILSSIKSLKDKNRNLNKEIKNDYTVDFHAGKIRRTNLLSLYYEENSDILEFVLGNSNETNYIKSTSSTNDGDNQDSNYISSTKTKATDSNPINAINENSTKDIETDYRSALNKEQKEVYDIVLELQPIDSLCDSSIEYTDTPPIYNKNTSNTSPTYAKPSFFQLVNGLPGTGKTTVINAIILGLLRKNHSVLVVTFTNTSLDHILLKIDRSLQSETPITNTNYKILRLGSTRSTHPPYHKYIYSNDIKNQNINRVSEYNEYIQNINVLFSTSFALATSNISKIFDYCIIDESTQLEFSMSINPLIKSKRYILFGDMKQLPPISIGDNLNISIFEMLSNHYRNVIYLKEQYRMCLEICNLSNDIVYNGLFKTTSDELKYSKWSHGFDQDENANRINQDENSQTNHYNDQSVNTQPSDISNIKPNTQPSNISNTRSRLPWPIDVLIKERRSVFLNTDLIEGREIRTSDGSYYNILEARMIGILYQVLLANNINNLPIDVTVITPYNAQKEYIIKHLNTLNIVIKVFTIDESQGYESDCVILSLVRRNNIKDYDSLINDIRRFNVAITRSRMKLIVIGSKNTLNNSILCSKLIDMIDKNNGIINADYINDYMNKMTM
eukprot:GHVP01005292.1.p1 GENE.GHVP01005292.1~~GHVP01005292.1.p1  ORF type:complete len:1605 (-),score=198.83 GHVP01005292.1:950-5074(-)